MKLEGAGERKRTDMFEVDAEAACCKCKRAMVWVPRKRVALATLRSVARALRAGFLRDGLLRCFHSCTGTVPLPSTQRCPLYTTLGWLALGGGGLPSKVCSPAAPYEG